MDCNTSGILANNFDRTTTRRGISPRQFKNDPPAYRVAHHPGEREAVAWAGQLVAGTPGPLQDADGWLLPEHAPEITEFRQELRAEEMAPESATNPETLFARRAARGRRGR